MKHWPIVNTNEGTRRKNLKIFHKNRFVNKKKLILMNFSELPRYTSSNRNKRWGLIDEQSSQNKLHLQHSKQGSSEGAVQNT